MTNTQNYSNQLKEILSKITVLVCMTTFESYGSLSENFIIAAMLNPSLKSCFISEFSRFIRIKIWLLENKKPSKIKKL